jgi:CHASE2 domain-containing sensor protein
MTLRLFHQFTAREWRRALGVGLAVAALGLCLWGSRFGAGLDAWSYDWLIAFHPKAPPLPITIVRMDEAAHQLLGQSHGQPWDRALHARLVEKLRSDQAKLVVFDLFFADPGKAEATQLLAEAIRRNGKVLLAGDLASQQRPGIVGQEPVPPLAPLRDAAAGWGIAHLERDPDLTIRRLYSGSEAFPSLPWAAAAMLRAPLTQREGGRSIFFQTERWIRYYKETEAFRTVSYHLALDAPAGFFRDQIVFVGGKPRTLFVAEEADEFRTPMTRRTGEHVSGVDIQAAQLLNLLFNDSFRRLGGWPELFLLLGVGFGAGIAFGLGRLPRRWVCAGAFGVALAVVTLALVLERQGVWFGWLTVIGAQLPAAWGVAWFMHARTPASAATIEPRPLQSQPAQSPAPAASNEIGAPVLSSTSAGEPRAPVLPVPSGWAPPISGHTLLQRIGGGAYGDVWLARSIIGGFRAVKLIRRERFRSAAPFEREFRGMQKFTPISLTHPGLVHVLHVDRDDAAGHFYYIMEAGDDEFAGQNIDPASYRPKTLAKELKRRGRIPIEECLQLALALTSALEHLHKQQLIHRDIKPSNIIFVKGQAKLADIGLVTDMSGPGSDVTDIGTEGYMAPEGPGTAAADLYSLGKVLYEAAMGYDCARFPELPTTLLERAPEMPRLLDLNEIILKACSDKVADRYQTAGELYAALEALQRAVRPVTQTAN